MAKESVCIACNGDGIDDSIFYKPPCGKCKGTGKQLNITYSNKPIPTAEEMEESGEFDDYTSMMREFARRHVTAALEAAHKQHQLPEEDLNFTTSCYPLNKIQ